MCLILGRSIFLKQKGYARVYNHTFINCMREGKFNMTKLEIYIVSVIIHMVARMLETDFLTML